MDAVDGKLGWPSTSSKLKLSGPNAIVLEVQAKAMASSFTPGNKSFGDYLMFTSRIARFLRVIGFCVTLLIKVITVLSWRARRITRSSVKSVLDRIKLGYSTPRSGSSSCGFVSKAQLFTYLLLSLTMNLVICIISAQVIFQEEK